MFSALKKIDFVYFLILTYPKRINRGLVHDLGLLNLFHNHVIYLFLYEFCSLNIVYTWWFRMKNVFVDSATCYAIECALLFYYRVFGVIWVTSYMIVINDYIVNKENWRIALPSFSLRNIASLFFFNRWKVERCMLVGYVNL